MASTEAVLRLRPDFWVGLDSPWVGNHFMFSNCSASSKTETLRAFRKSAVCYILHSTVTDSKQLLPEMSNLKAFDLKK